ncbi:8-amino-7-oxononanoate synthase [Sulfobacillus thermosulfidooxidans]|uniref:8-amino-7-oxononanoate synthase n=1 Tax=Sulfobacillus thermosulfidooxidans TaxID=28034 RepID=UPI0006B62A5A|nr:8-amino-7-oxononanoate synthase [Sulfobacillus thermosulfidooxidans]
MSYWKEWIAKEEERLRQQDNWRILPSNQGTAPGRIVQNANHKILSFASNDYLGLAHHPAVIEQAQQALKTYGTGSTGSRLLTGNSKILTELERALAVWKGTEAALVFPSGYHVNISVLAAVTTELSHIFSDAANHASIIDGCRLSRAKTFIYRHNDLDHLRQLLAASVGADRRFIVTEGVFSMDGDVAPLPDLLDLAEEYEAVVVLDDAHGTGVMGIKGRGTLAAFQLQSDNVWQIGTLSKAVAAQGGFVAGPRSLIDYLVNKARAFIFSTGLNPAAAGAALEAIHIAQEEEWRREHIQRGAESLRQGLKDLGYHVFASGILATPIVPVLIGSNTETLKVAQALWDQDIYAPAIKPPTVPPGTSRLRLAVSAAHHEEDIARTLAAFRRIKDDLVGFDGTK